MRSPLGAALVAGLALACAPAQPEDPAAVSRAAEVRDARALEDTLHELDAWLAEHYPQAAARLRPGLTDAEIDAALDAAGFAYTLPEELRQLYRWHDGMEPDGDLPLVWYHRFLGLEETLRRGGGSFLGLPANALTVFGFPEEDYYVLCPPEAVESLPVHHRLLESPEPTLAFTSLGTMLRTGLEWYTRGAVRPDGSGWLTEDIEEVARIHAELNPGSTFPFAVP